MKKERSRSAEEAAFELRRGRSDHGDIEKERPMWFEEEGATVDGDGSSDQYQMREEALSNSCRTHDQTVRKPVGR